MNENSIYSTTNHLFLKILFIAPQLLADKIIDLTFTVFFYILKYNTEETGYHDSQWSELVWLFLHAPSL